MLLICVPVKTRLSDTALKRVGVGKIPLVYFELSHDRDAAYVSFQFFCLFMQTITFGLFTLI